MTMALEGMSLNSTISYGLRALRKPWKFFFLIRAGHLREDAIFRTNPTKALLFLDEKVAYEAFQ